MGELEAYLLSHRGHKARGLHKVLLDEAAASLPSVLGYDNYMLFKERILAKGKITFGQADVVLLTPEEVVVIECGGHVINRPQMISHKIKDRLIRAYDFFMSTFSVAPRLIGVYRILGARGYEHYELPRPTEDLEYWFRPRQERVA